MPGTTPVYGFPYPEPTDLVADYPALGQQLAEDIEDVLPTIGGLVPAKPTTIANSGGTAALSGNTVTFTTVNSVSLNNCFSATTDSYRLVVSGTASAGASPTDLFMRLRVGGVDATASNYYQLTLYTQSTVNPTRNSQTTTNFQFGYLGDYISICVFDVTRPFLAARTAITGSAIGRGTTTPIIMQGGGGHDLQTSYDGFTLYPSSGTITGTVNVYGYTN